MGRTKVTSNVMDNISNRIKDRGFSFGEGKALIMINGASLDISNGLEFSQELKNNGFEIGLGFSFMAERLLDTKKIIDRIKPTEIFKEEDISKIKYLINNYSMVVGPNITMNTLSKISVGMIDSFVPNAIWSFLYFGKKVYLDFNSARNYMGQPTSSKEISDILEKNIKVLVKMGAVEIDSTSKFLNMEKIVLKEEQQLKDLITEKDIAKLIDNQKKIVVNKKTLITPLAKDKARELGVSIEIK